MEPFLIRTHYVYIGTRKSVLASDVPSFLESRCMQTFYLGMVVVFCLSRCPYLRVSCLEASTVHVYVHVCISWSGVWFSAHHFSAESKPKADSRGKLRGHVRWPQPHIVMCSSVHHIRTALLFMYMYMYIILEVSSHEFCSVKSVYMCKDWVQLKPIVHVRTSIAL